MLQDICQCLGVLLLSVLLLSVLLLSVVVAAVVAAVVAVVDVSTKWPIFVGACLQANGPPRGELGGPVNMQILLRCQRNRGIHLSRRNNRCTKCLITEHHIGR